MADMTTIKERIAETIYPNGTGAITAEAHQALLLEMVDDINAKKQDAEEGKGLVSEAERMAWNNKADKTGRYPEMSVGFADNLVGRGESTPAEFSFRASGGKSIKDGAARIKRLKGNSVVWNQLIPNPTAVHSKDETTVFNDGTRIDKGHQYLLFADIDGDNPYISASIYTLNQSIVTLYNQEAGYKFFSTDMSLESDGTDNANEGNIWQYFYFPDGQGTGSVKNVRLIDLTREFGAGNEPITIEEYYARKPIVEDEYAYNEGELIHMTAEGIKSVSDNAFDVRRDNFINVNAEMIVNQGDFSFMNESDVYVGVSVNGYGYKESIDKYSKLDRGYAVQNNNRGYGLGLMVKALPNQEYALKWNSDKGGVSVGYYDADKSVIDYNHFPNRFTTPSNCEYLLLVVTALDDYNGQEIEVKDIMLTLVHSGWKQDTDAGYQPYWEDRLMFDERIKEHFPNGMKKWDMVYNRNGKGYVVKGTGVVDLGELAWEHEILNGYEMFRSKNNLLGATPTSGDGTNLICARYVDGNELIYTEGLDKSIELNQGYYGSVLVQDFLAVRDTSYTDAASFKAAMAGVLLYYQLAEPTIIEYDEPFNFDYRVADFGTEQMLTEQPSAPIAADIIYQFNAVDMIRELWLKVQELEARLNG